jgi:hypothetical protein
MANVLINLSRLLLRCCILPVLVVFCHNAQGQEKVNFCLGDGVVVVKYEPWKTNDSKSVVLYKDNKCTIPFVNLTIDNTNCPKCMECAEPESYYNGLLRPLICSASEGIVFAGEKYGEGEYKIFIDTTGLIAYAPKHSSLIFFSWSDYMIGRGRKGEYFSFDRSWNHNVIYNRKYEINSLPKANKEFIVGTKIKDIEDVKFYPVLVDGYWMKIKGIKNGQWIGYYWIIWRNEKDWLIDFSFNPD